MKQFVALLILATASPFLLSQSMDEGQTSQEIPFQLFEGHVVLVEGSVRGLQPLRVIIDTGATHSVVSKRIVKKLGLKRYAQSSKVHAFGRPQKTETVVLNQVRIGPMLTTMVCFVSDLPWSKVDVIVGMDVLQRHNLTIDYARKTIRFGVRESFEATIPFRLEAGQVIVELQIAGRNVLVAIDTGASRLILEGNKAERWASGPVVNSPKDVVIAGRASRQRTTYFKDVRLGPTEWKS